MLFDHDQEWTKAADERLQLWRAGRVRCRADDVLRFSLQSAVESLLKARDIYVKAEDLGSE